MRAPNQARWILEAAMFCALLAFASPAHAQRGASRDARKQYVVGKDLVDEGQFQEAYEAFHRAYAISPVPDILERIAFCARKLERDGEAIASYERYLAEAETLREAQMVEIAKTLDVLQTGSGELKLEVSPKDAEVEVIDTRTPSSGQPRVNRYSGEEIAKGLRLRAGDHELRIQADGYDEETLEVEVEAGTKVVQRLELRKEGAPAEAADEPKSKTPEPEPEPEEVEGDGGLGTGTIAMLAVTGGLAVGAVVVGVLALDAKANYDTYVEGGSRADAEDVRSTGELLNGLTDGFIAGAGAAAIVSAVLLGLDLSGDDTETAVVVGPAYLGVTGRF